MGWAIPIYRQKSGAGKESLFINSGSLTVAYTGTEPYSKLNVGDRTDGLLKQQDGTVTLASPSNEMSISGGGAKGTYEISGGTLNTGKIKNGWVGGGTVHIIGDAADINLSGNSKSYYQNSLSTLKVDIGCGISMIDVTDSVDLNAEEKLEVAFTVTPTVGQTFDIIKYGSLSGAFGTLGNFGG